MKSWLRERFQAFPMFILASGLAASGTVSVDGAIHYGPMAVCSVLIWALLLQNRLLEDARRIDFGRPPERVRISSLALRAWAGRIQVVLLLASLILMIVPASRIAGGLFAAVSLYVWLHGHDVLLGRKRSRSPFWHALGLQVVTLPLVVFPATLVSPERIDKVESWLAGLLIFGATFSYDVGRRLDRKAHPRQSAALIRHGPMAVSWLITVLSLLSAYAALRFGLTVGIASSISLLVMTWSILLAAPELFRWVELAALVNLIVQVWLLPVGALLPKG